MDQKAGEPNFPLSSRHSRLVWPEIESRMDWIAEEVPVALVYNGISHAVMMASPAQLQDLALGFSLSEGIVSVPEDIYAMDIVTAPLGVEVRMELCSRRFVELKRRRRYQAGPSGCGLCGVESLAQVMKTVTRVNRDWKISHAAIQRGVSQLRQYQELQQQTGAVHAAAWCDAEGNVEIVREDVGRHNALDKLLGRITTADLCESGFVLMSSRASFELLQKVAVANLPHLVTISAPTSKAIELANSSGVTLVGFARSGRHQIYSHTDGVG